MTKLPLLDIDDHIEYSTKKKVSDIIQEIGEDAFLDLESEIVQSIKPQGMIISCSGSVPLRQEAMNHLRETGKSIYIDVPVSIIVARLHRMKADRIIGMNGKSPMTLEEVLAYRESFYEMSYDYRFSCTDNITADEKAIRFLDFCKMKIPDLIPKESKKEKLAA
ncbi:hypothetical protein GW830_00180 [bacterium]|nr:hypothetical protein [bacterium]